MRRIHAVVTAGCMLLAWGALAGIASARRLPTASAIVRVERLDRGCDPDGMRGAQVTVLHDRGFALRRRAQRIGIPCDPPIARGAVVEVSGRPFALATLRVGEATVETMPAPPLESIAGAERSAIEADHERLETRAGVVWYRTGFGVRYAGRRAREVRIPTPPGLDCVAIGQWIGAADAPTGSTGECAWAPRVSTTGSLSLTWRDGELRARARPTAP